MVEPLHVRTNHCTENTFQDTEVFALHPSVDYLDPLESEWDKLTEQERQDGGSSRRTLAVG